MPRPWCTPYSQKQHHPRHNHCTPLMVSSSSSIPLKDNRNNRPPSFTTLRNLVSKMGMSSSCLSTMTYFSLLPHKTCRTDLCVPSLPLQQRWHRQQAPWYILLRFLKKPLHWDTFLWGGQGGKHASFVGMCDLWNMLNIILFKVPLSHKSGFPSLSEFYMNYD